MDDNDPITQFFPGEEDVDLYAVLSLTNDATVDAVKKAYRKLALVYHPDKHANSSQKVKEDASNKFQQVGFAYAVLSDAKRKARYDSTGKTDEGFDLGAGEDGWDAYFEQLFDRVTKGKLDEDRKAYQDSDEEVTDLKAAYLETNGSLGDIMTHIPHSTHLDEERFISIINALIQKGDLESTAKWRKTSKDEKAKKARKKEGEKEALEAEERAKELGIWEEIYGNGKPSDKRKGKATAESEEAEDVSVLQALILKKKEKNTDSFFDKLAAKYAEPEGKGSRKKGKKRGAEEAEDGGSPQKKARSEVPPPDIDDEEFAKLQSKLFGDKSKASAGPSGKKARARKAR